MREVLLPAAAISTSTLRGHHGNPILLLKAKIGRKELEEWWSRFCRKLGPQELRSMEEIAGERVDQACNLYLRFDKQKALLGKLQFSDGDDVIHVKLKISVRPAKPEFAVQKLVEYLRRLRV
jgi:hypothetical protein